MSDFSVETRYYARYGLHPHVMYDVLDSGTARRRSKKKIVPEFYGRPRLHGEALARLMNAWRRRALALPETSVPIYPAGKLVVARMSEAKSGTAQAIGTS